ncbi:MAG: glucose-1-phosphate adenylyltransferase subunit GlgD [Clostridia bacterium]|nr:glucose-1-phosphate adenylyltransferase subunit GlgD [Clostridia bacterium]
MNALGIIFCDHYSENTPKNELIQSRTPAALPYAGRYRTIDFALSGMVNAGISDIGVICKENYGSLLDHLGSGEDWDLNRRKGGIMLLTPLSRPEHTTATRGRLDALRAVKGFIAGLNHELVVMAFGGTVANIDLEAMMEEHLKNDAYLTVAYSRIPAGAGEMMVHSMADGRIESITYKQSGTREVGNFAIGAYVMSKKDLMEFLEEADNNDYTNMNRELIQKNLPTRKICGYEHNGYARIIRTVEEYYAASMDMLDPKAKMDLFAAERPVYTKVKDSVPTLYDYHAIVENSLIADGCTIKGTVKNSVIFRGVTVEEGAVVEDSILMQRSVVGKNAKVSRTITDKNVTVSEDCEMQGTAALPFVIGKGKKV